MYVLAFKNSYFELRVQIWTKGTLKRLTRHYESIFETTNFPVYNLVILATSAAFLALMALKLKNNQICQQRTPNGPVDIKKLSNLDNIDSPAFVWPS